MRRFPTLSRSDLELISQNQIAQQRSWREVPPDGREVACCGEGFLVLPKVFPPRGDSRLMIDNMGVRRGTSVLDMGTGSGVLAIFAVLRGARAAVALDISPDAVRNATENARRHGLQDIVEARLSDGFSAVAASETFDLMIANLPGRNEAATDLVEAAQWDSGFETHKAFFAQAPAHLAPGGRILMTKANYPELNDVIELAEHNGFEANVLARTDPSDGEPRTYYALAFSLR